MDIQQLLQTFAERVSNSASVRSVYGDPVVVGNRTVIPVAQVGYAFGGGGGARADSPNGGGGAGGKAYARPSGALEVTPEGTRFIDFVDRPRMGAALALGFVLGAAVVALTGTKRIEVVKRLE
jgi:uncharacterized spore protein YtfJ